MSPPATGRLRAALLGPALALGVLATGCGSPSDAPAETSARQQPAAPAESTPASPAASPAASPSQGRELATEQEVEQELDEVGRERARREAVPGAVPVSPGTAEAGAPGTPVAQEGDVTLFPPVRRGEEIAVPVEIANTGARRAIYRVEVRVTGAGGFDATRSLETDTVGVYPGASWPTELTFTDPGGPVPDDPRVSIVSSSREIIG
ncbi:hypothetical protein NPS70_05600 [Streptomyces sp. C10-9-1]|uniref:hypothetical protein n=1 Tax=Streptomyces sp. C10-9-1 TaxID=1859285 RepID=UPI0021111C82|nr:hypothetical protein [Streptomyces sp. C10-9-1]MCQ6552672.1 hypothetical protein [Streptomyces sp. C10-9-1]